MILITSATGTVGREIVKILKSKGAAIRIASRNPEAAKSQLGVDAFSWDWDHPEGFPKALEAVSTLFLGTPPGTTQEKEWGITAVEAAKKAGVRKIVKLSAINVENMPDSPHRQIELAIEASGLQWVFLRPGFFMQNLDEGMAAGIKASGEIAIPSGEGKTSFIDARDIAAVAAIALEEDRLNGHGYTLTGGQALNYTEVAAELTKTVGYTVKHNDIAPAEYTKILIQAGVPAPYAAFLTTLYDQVVRQGHAAYISGAVKEISGNEPRTLNAYAKDYAAAFKR